MLEWRQPRVVAWALRELLGGALKGLLKLTVRRSCSDVVSHLEAEL